MACPLPHRDQASPLILSTSASESLKAPQGLQGNAWLLRRLPQAFSLSPEDRVCALWLTPNRTGSTSLSALLLPAGRSPVNPHCSVFLTSARALLTTQGSGRHRCRPTPLSCTHGLSLGLEPQTSLSSGQVYAHPICRPTLESGAPPQT